MITRVGIIGFGRFGRALAELLHQTTINVCAVDTAHHVPDAYSTPSLSSLAACSDLIVLAMPVPLIGEALTCLRPHLSPHHTVCDVGSVKVGPSGLLEQSLGSTIPWVATHPLFGPASLARGERPLQVVICPNTRHPLAVDRVTEFFRDLGCSVIRQDAEAHDRAMAETHALAFYLAKGLLDIGAGEKVPFAPPSFKAIATAIEAVRSDAGHLFFAIQHENPFAAEARKRLLTALIDIDHNLLAANRGEVVDGLEIDMDDDIETDVLNLDQLAGRLDEQIEVLQEQRAALDRLRSR